MPDLSSVAAPTIGRQLVRFGTAVGGWRCPQWWASRLYALYGMSFGSCESPTFALTAVIFVGRRVVGRRVRKSLFRERRRVYGAAPGISGYELETRDFLCF